MEDRNAVVLQQSPSAQNKSSYLDSFRLLLLMHSRGLLARGIADEALVLGHLYRVTLGSLYLFVLQFFFFICETRIKLPALTIHPIFVRAQFECERERPPSPPQALERLANMFSNFFPKLLGVPKRMVPPCLLGHSLFFWIFINVIYNHRNN